MGSICFTEKNTGVYVVYVDLQCYSVITWFHIVHVNRQFPAGETSVADFIWNSGN